MQRESLVQDPDYFAIDLFILSVYRAYNESTNSTAACKHMQPSTDAERKTIEKEMRIHANLKNRHILEFINAVVVDSKQQSNYVPGMYMLLELAAGGDLFDKIGAWPHTTKQHIDLTRYAQHRMLAFLKTSHTTIFRRFSPEWSVPQLSSFFSLTQTLPSHTSTTKACATET